MAANDKQLRDLIEIIHFIENVSAKIHGLLDEAKIYATVKKEFAKSKQYTAIILLLTVDGSQLQIVESSIAPKLIKKGEKAAGLRMKGYKIDLDKSSIYSQVVREGKTVQVNTSDIIGELFPQAIASLVSKVIGYERRPAILSPLKRRGEIIGAFAMTSIEMSEHLIPSVRNLALHISTALEIADEYTKRVQAEATLKESRDAYKATFENTGTSMLIGEEDTTISMINTEFEKLCGYSKEEVEGKISWIKFIAKADLERMKESHNLRMIDPSAAPPYYEFQFIDKQGNCKYILITLARIPATKKTVGSLIDITERKKNEEELRESEALYRAVFEQAADSIVLIDIETGELKNFNNRAYETLGYTREEFKKLKISDFEIIESAEEVAKHIRKIADEGFDTFETKHKTKDGEILTIQVSARAISVGGRDFIQSIWRDITERVKAKEAYQTLVEKSLQGLAILRSDGIVFANSSISEMLGYTIEELISLSSEEMRELVHPEDQALVWGRFADRLEGISVPPQYEFRLVNKDGTVHWVDMFSSLITFHGHPAVQATFIDITERKQAEDELRESENRYRELCERMSSGVAVYEVKNKGKDFIFKEINIAGQRISDVSREDVIGRGVQEVFPGFKDMGLLDVFKHVWKTGEAEHYPVTQYKDDRISHWVENFVYKLPTGEIVAVYDDLTERMRAVEALMESEDMYRTLFERVPVGLYRTTPEGHIMDANPVMVELLGFPDKESLLGVNAQDLYVEPRARRHALTLVEYEDLLSGLEIQLRRRDGTTIWVRDRARAVLDSEGQVQHYEGSMVNITERKRAEEELRENEERFDLAVRGSTDGLWVRDYTTGTAWWSPRFYELLGYEDGEIETSYARLTELMHPEDRDQINEAIRAHLEERVPYNTKYRLLMKSGEYRWFRTRAQALWNEDGNPIRMAGSIQDITEQVRAEEALRQSEERYRVIVDDQTELVNRWLPDGTLTFVNEAYYRYYGRSYEECIGKKWIKLVAKEDQKQVKAYMEQLKVSLSPDNPTMTGEHREVSADGSIRWVRWVDQAIFDEQGHLIEFQSVGRDINEHKQAQEALRESEEKLATIFETVSDMIIHVDRRGKIVDVNKRVEDLLGYNRDEVIGKNFFEIGVFRLKDLPGIIKLFRSTVQKGKPIVTIDLELKHRNGKKVFVEADTRFILKNGKVVGSVSCLRDITDRKRAEEELRTSEERFDLAVKGSTDGLWDRDIISDAEWWSPRYYELLGYEDGEIDSSYAKFIELLHPEDRDTMIEAERTHLEERVPLDVRYRLLTKSGAYRCFRARAQALWDKDGNPIRIAGSIQDITEQVRAGEALRWSEERYRGIVEVQTELVDRWLPDGTLTFVNEAYCRYFDKQPEELVGQKWMKQIAKEDKKQVKARVEELITSLSPDNPFVMDEHREVMADGQIRWLRWVNQAIFDERGLLIEFQSVGRDITELKQAQEELKEYSERLEEMVEEGTQELRDAQEQLIRREKLAAIGKMAGGVGHELRNPLAVISNALYLLKTISTDDAYDKEAMDEYLEMISEEVHNADKIVNDLLNFARALTAEREETLVTGLISQVMEKQPLPENVEAKVEIDPDLQPVFVDARQMEQVLVNLIVNAYQAMPEGGRLTVKAQGEEAMVRISIIDTGCGISKENMKNIFEPLFTTKTRGIGLGLAISKDMVEANGGSIEVESEEGKGSAFMLKLPVVEAVISDQ